MIEAPCKDCPKKGCGSYHDQCPDYQNYRKEKTKVYEERRLRIKTDSDLDQINDIRMWKWKKAHTRMKQR